MERYIGRKVEGLGRKKWVRKVVVKYKVLTVKAVMVLGAGWQVLA